MLALPVMRRRQIQDMYQIRRAVLAALHTPARVLRAVRATQQLMAAAAQAAHRPGRGGPVARLLVLVRQEVLLIRSWGKGWTASPG